MAVDCLRKGIIIALLKSKFGEEIVLIETSSTRQKIDVLLYNNSNTIKTILQKILQRKELKNFLNQSTLKFEENKNETLSISN